MRKTSTINRFGPLDIARFLYHLPNFAKLYLRLWQDRRVSWMAKSFVILALLYIAAPVDIAMDWIPVLGQLDDLAIMVLALRTFVRMSPQEVVKEHVAAIDVASAHL